MKNEHNINYALRKFSSLSSKVLLDKIKQDGKVDKKKKTVKYGTLQKLLAQGRQLDSAEKLPDKDKKELSKSINLLRKLVKKTDSYIEFIKKSVTNHIELNAIPGIFMNFIDISANLLSEKPSSKQPPAKKIIKKKSVTKKTIKNTSNTMNTAKTTKNTGKKITKIDLEKEMME